MKEHVAGGIFRDIGLADVGIVRVLIVARFSVAYSFPLTKFFCLKGNHRPNYP